MVSENEYFYQSFKGKHTCPDPVSARSCGSDPFCRTDQASTAVEGSVDPHFDVFYLQNLHDDDPSCRQTWIDVGLGWRTKKKKGGPIY